MATKEQYFNQNMAPEVHNEKLKKLIIPTTYAGDPTNNLDPDFQDQLCRDTSNNALYWASTELKAGWKKLSP